MLTEIREEQPEKHRYPKLVTEDGISIEVREEQSEKHLCPKLVTVGGILTEVT